MMTTRISMCMLLLCLLSACGGGEKKTNEPMRINVAEAEITVPSSKREFSFISKPFNIGAPLPAMRLWQ